MAPTWKRSVFVLLAAVLLVALVATWAKGRPSVLSTADEPALSDGILKRVEAQIEAKRGEGRLLGGEGSESGSAKVVKKKGENAAEAQAKALNEIKEQVLGVLTKSVTAAQSNPKQEEKALLHAQKAEIATEEQRVPSDAETPSISRAKADGRREAEQGANGEKAAEERAAKAAAADYAASRKNLMQREVRKEQRERQAEQRERGVPLSFADSNLLNTLDNVYRSDGPNAPPPKPAAPKRTETARVAAADKVTAAADKAKGKGGAGVRAAGPGKATATGAADAWAAGASLARPAAGSRAPAAAR